MLAGVINSSVAALLAARGSRGTGRVDAATAVARPVLAATAARSDRISLSGGVAALRDVGGIVDQLARAGNTLAVASASLTRISGLLDRVHGALTDTGSDESAKQAAVDTAVAQLDDTAASARFAGKSLFTGAFAVSIPGSSLTLPLVSSKSLGVDTAGAGSLASITGQQGGAGDDQAVATVDLATAQVGAARMEIEQFRATRISPALSRVQSVLQDDAGAVTSPEIARTVALLARAQTVVQPQRVSAAAGSPGAQNVFSLVA